MCALKFQNRYAWLQRTFQNLQCATGSRKLTLVGLLVFLLGVTGCAPLLDYVSNRFFLPVEGIRKQEHAVSTSRGVGFRTMDGIELRADIHRPKGLEKTPTILIRIPFTRTLANRLRADSIARYWASRGYTVVIQGTRGRYESDGTFYPLIHEHADGIETLHWLAKQSWYDGRLAMWGASAFGHTQWAIADQSRPGPDALFVQIASTNFREMFFPGNAFSLESALYWAMNSRPDRNHKVNMGDLEKGVWGFPVIEADDRAFTNSTFFNDWLINQDDDAYWTVVDGTNRTHTLQASMLLMAGWFDPFLPSQLKDFVNIVNHAEPDVAEEVRLIIGPWGHARAITMPNGHKPMPFRFKSLAPTIPWFDSCLGMTDVPLSMPRVQIFVMGINEWRSENEWPLARTEYTNFYLHSGGSANSPLGNGVLDKREPKTVEIPDTYCYDPQNPVPTTGGAMLGPRSGIQPQNQTELRPDVLVYTTAPLSEATEVTGPVHVILYVSTDVSSTDFTAKLVDVYPDGQAYNLCDGILRRDYQQGQLPEKIKIELWATSNVFRAGHRIRMEISSSNFPRYDRNPNTGEFIPTATRTVSANQTIFHSAEHPSRLILPIIPAADSN